MTRSGTLLCFFAVLCCPTAIVAKDWPPGQEPEGPPESEPEPGTPWSGTLTEWRHNKYCWIKVEWLDEDTDPICENPVDAGHGSASAQAAVPNGSVILLKSFAMSWATVEDSTGAFPPVSSSCAHQDHVQVKLTHINLAPNAPHRATALVTAIPSGRAVAEIGTPHGKASLDVETQIEATTCDTNAQTSLSIEATASYFTQEEGMGMEVGVADWMFGVGAAAAQVFAMVDNPGEKNYSLTGELTDAVQDVDFELVVSTANGSAYAMARRLPTLLWEGASPELAICGAGNLDHKRNTTIDLTCTYGHSQATVELE